MLIEFSLNNYLSFKDPVTLSMIGSTPVKEHEEVENSNIIFDNIKNKFLKSAVIYGANGSGKSNLIAAMLFVKNFVLNSSKESQVDEEIKVISYLLNELNNEKPCSFEIVFLIDEIRYRYGFEVDKKIVHAEWLFSTSKQPLSKEKKLFIREFQNISVNRTEFKEGKGVELRTRENTLFLSAVAQWNNDNASISSVIIKWFRYKLNFVSGLDDNTIPYTIYKFQNDPIFRNRVISFFNLINIGFDNIIIDEVDLSKIELSKLSKDTFNELNATKNVTIETVHKKFSSNGDLVGTTNLPFNLQSEGTKKLFGLIGPLFDTIDNDIILVIDELDARFHPLLTMELIKLFHSKINSKSQLIFTSHDTNLLRKDIFRRDQIWFTEKNNEGATDLYSLIEYKVNQALSVRNDASFGKDYLLGKYGAIPYFGDIAKFLNDFINEQEQVEA